MKISVALCTYNGEKYLREQIDSILKQDCKVDEIVVCDDGSIDDTIMILKEYKKEYPLLFRVYQNAENLGYIKNFEKALLLCTQEVVFLSDQDDIWYQEKVSDVLQYFKENPYKKVLAHNLDLLNSEIKNKTFWDIKDFKNNDQTLSQKELLKYILVNGNKFPGMSIAIHNKTLRKYLPFINNNAFIIHDFESSF
jgi:glycosyltransferase involved in cell wall biosynthesis